MGTSTMTRTAAASAVKLYLITSVRFRMETCLPESDLEIAAQADWASTGEKLSPVSACVEIERALAAIRLLLTRKLSEGARIKLEHDREVLEWRAVRAAHAGIESRLADRDDPHEIMRAVKVAKRTAYCRYEVATDIEIQFQLLRHMQRLNELELEARVEALDDFRHWT